MKEPRLKASDYEYSRKLPHHQRGWQPLFVTFSVREGIWLSDSSKQIVFDACLFNNGRLMDLHALVVMATHVHLLCSMRFDDDLKLIPLKKLTHSIKRFSAHEINRKSYDFGPVWQEESFDHVVRNQETFSAKLLYIRMNPVRAGLVKRAEDYPWFWQAPDCSTGETPVRTK